MPAEITQESLWLAIPVPSSGSSFLLLVKDRPLEKLWGGGRGRGIFELQELFFGIKFLVLIFF